MLIIPRELYPLVVNCREGIKAGKAQWALGEAVKRLARDAKCLRVAVSASPTAPTSTIVLDSTNLPDPDADRIIQVHELWATINGTKVLVPEMNETMVKRWTTSVSTTAIDQPSGWYSRGATITLVQPVGTAYVYEALVSYAPYADDPCEREFELPPDAQEALVACAKGLIYGLPSDTDNQTGDPKVIAHYFAEYAAYMANCKNAIEFGENGDVFLQAESFVGFKRR